jgi:peptidoglycan/LPS O-acetylase OafA/YrhL
MASDLLISATKPASKDPPLRIAFRSQLATSDSYRPDIDGLRALAVLPVLFYHAHLALFPGGYVGVDIFFVISGYLITSIIAPDILLGRFSFATFYERRVRRIFPALFAVVAFSILGAALLFPPMDFVSFGKSLMAMTFFVSNIFFKRQAGSDGYFGDISEMQALLHTWSLSVEEQFYLFFPISLVLVARWVQGRQSLFLLPAILISFLTSVWAVHYKPPAAFYLLVSRAWELLMGSILAIGVVPPLRARTSREIAGLSGLGLILYAVLAFSKDTDFPGVNAVVPCLGAFLILHAGQCGYSFARSILSIRPLVFVGVISYSLYLWHWPILVFGRRFAAGPLTGSETAWAVFLSFLMAFLSFEFIECPFRGRSSRLNRQSVFALAFAASAFSLVVALIIVSQDGIPERYAAPVRDKVLRNVERKGDYQEVCGNWRKDIHAITDITFCNVGASGTHNVLFWGDSHIQQLYPLIEKMYADNTLPYHGAVFVIAAGCPPTERMNNAHRGYHCDSFARFAMQRAEQGDIDTVFIAFSTWWAAQGIEDAICPSVEGTCVATIPREEQLAGVVQELAEHVEMLRNRGKHVIISLPFPLFDKSIPDLEIRNAVFGPLGLVGTATDETDPTARQRVIDVAHASGADIFDPRRSLCHSGACITQLDGISIYRDSTHIAASQIDILEENLEEVLRRGK